MELALPEVRYYASPSGRSEALQYVLTLPAKARAQVLADVEAYRLYGVKAPISWKSIAGHRPLFEIRVGANRLYCVVHRETLWVLQSGPKAHQPRDIAKAAERMRHVREA
jgi:hypothetical protein